MRDLATSVIAVDCWDQFSSRCESSFLSERRCLMSFDGENGAIDVDACAQYPHQVGGHGQIVQADETSVLKPLVEKEASFYELVWAADAPENVHWLRKFTPQYLGRRSVLPTPMSSHGLIKSSVPRAGSALCCEKSDAEGKGALATTGTRSSAHDIPEERIVRDVPVAPSKTVVRAPSIVESPEQGLRRNTDGTPDYDHLRWAPSASTNESGLTNGASNVVASTGNLDPCRGGKQGLEVVAVDEPEGTAQRVSPWAVHMADRKPSASSHASKVIVLEDINRCFHYPCIADCKCGKRHFDDDATAEKQRRHKLKAESTTTAATGIRYIGLQSLKGTVYQFRDKYHGRRLVVADLIPGMYWFFHNGTILRRECVRLTLGRLRDIAGHMESNHTFLFYSSSLLLVYEGDTSRMSRVDVRMIDFAHTQLSKGERDDGYIEGIMYLIDVLEAVLECRDDNPPLGPSDAANLEGQE